MGIFIAILAACSGSALDIFLKKLSDTNPNFLTWIRGVSAMPVLAVLVTIFTTWDIPALQFWLLLFIAAVPLEVALGYCVTRSIHLSPISLVGPLAAFSSVFLIPVGFFI